MTQLIKARADMWLCGCEKCESVLSTIEAKMRIDQDCLMNGEVVACSHCAKDVEMTVQRKIKRKRAVSEGIEIRVFCDAACGTDFYNAKKRSDKVEA